MSYTTNDKLMTVNEVAEKLRLSPRTIHRYGVEGKLSVVKLNVRTFRYTASSVEALMNPSGDEHE